MRRSATKRTQFGRNKGQRRSYIDNTNVSQIKLGRHRQDIDM